MMRIAIVEDEREARDELSSLIDKYFANKDSAYIVKTFSSGIDFLEGYKAEYDLVFMDIEMPGIDGMTSSYRIREKDSKVLIIFVTNMAQYAINGYKVDALDFFVKPVKENALFSLLDKAIRILKSREKSYITVSSQNGVIRINTSEIRYIEVIKHKIIFHLEREDISSWQSLKSIEEILPPSLFSKCNVCYLISLAHVKRVEGDMVVIGEDYLKISRPRKKQFLEDLAYYCGSMR